MRDLSYFEGIYGKGNLSLHKWIKERGSDPHVGYEYPTFEINAKGELVATYTTSNRNLRFRIDNPELVAIYNAEDPNLYIDENGFLVRRG